MGFLLDTLGQIGSTMLGDHLAKKQQEREQEFNAAEAEKARQFNADEAEKARDWQTQEREATQDWNLEQWNRENEYNSPEQQLARAMAAGINPNAAIQGISGSSTAGNVRSSAGSGAAASGPAASTPGSIAGSIADLVGNTVNNFWDNKVKRAQATGQTIENQYTPQIRESELRKADAETSNILENTKLTEAQRGQIYQTMHILAQKTPYEIQSMIAGINEAVARTGLIEEQTETEGYQQKVLDAQEKNIEQDTNLKYKQGLILDDEKTIKSIQAGLAEQGIIAGYNEVQALFMAANGGVDIGALTAPYLALQEAAQQIQTTAYGNQKQWDNWANNNAPQPIWTRIPEVVYHSRSNDEQKFGRSGNFIYDGAVGLWNEGMDYFLNKEENLQKKYAMPSNPQNGTVYGTANGYYIVKDGRIERYSPKPNRKPYTNRRHR